MNDNLMQPLSVQDSAANGQSNGVMPSRQAGWIKDFIASIVVFLVALPLCMGIAIASGVQPAAGIITGIIGGLLVSTTGGCRLQVSGPAAGLVVLYSDLLHNHGPEKMAIMLLIAGVLQLVAGAFKIAQCFRAVTPAVVNGMLTGIGILIFASQFHVMVDDTPKGSGINNLLSIPSAIVKAIVPNVATSHEEAALLGVSTILIMLLWDKFAPKKLRLIPGSLVAVLLATMIAWIGSFPVRRVMLPDNLLDAVHFPSIQSLTDGLANKDIWTGGLLIALLATAETLLTATAIDKIQSGSRTNYDRELTAQGLGNTACGLLGVLPMTGVMVRGGVNVAAGATSNRSAILHGVWLLLFVTMLPWVVKQIPISVLAALLVLTGYKLANFKVIKELAKFGRSEVAIYVVTVVIIVGVDLLSGVMSGIILAVIELLYAFSRLDIRLSYDAAINRADLWLSGAATFLNLPQVASALESVAPQSQLHVHLDALDYIDHASLDLLRTWDKQHQATGGIMVMDWDALGTVFQDRRRNPRPGYFANLS